MFYDVPPVELYDEKPFRAYIDLNHQVTPFGIDAEAFCYRMKGHWKNELGNVSSARLEKVWTQIASTFNEHITSHLTGSNQYWSVLSPPTGSGKTESAVLYCAMLADLPKDDHPGVIIVTRLIDDCDRIADRINRFGSRETAISYHSKKRAEDQLSPSDLENYPVIVITHRAYEIALDSLKYDDEDELDFTEDSSTWEKFHNWKNSWSNADNTRALVIVDERLDIVESCSVSLEEIRFTLGAIPERIREGYQRETRAMEDLTELLQTLRQAEQDNGLGSEQRETFFHGFPWSRDLLPDFESLADALRDVRFDRLLGKNDPVLNDHIGRQYRDTIMKLLFVIRDGSYYSNFKGIHSLNTARLLVPENINGAVILDGTAQQDVSYELHKQSRRIAPPEGSRTYRNVDLHYSLNNRVGKDYMKKNRAKLVETLMSVLEESFGPEDKVFICCHKDVEPLIHKYNPQFAVSTGHWGQVDGSNAWKDCNKIVIFGLPYLPDSWSANSYMALQGFTDSKWLQDKDHREWGDHKDIKKALEHSQLSTSIVQAINRGSCRKVINEHGDCPETDVYILLPEKGTADQILKDIKYMMPGIQTQQWNFPKQIRKQKGSHHEKALIAYINSLTPGLYRATDVYKELGMSRSTWNRLIKKLDDSDSTLSEAFTCQNVRYQIKREGRSDVGYLEKEV